MPISKSTSHIRFWLIIFGAIIGVSCLLRSMLVPFLAGLMIAYFLDPIVEKLAKNKIPFTKKKLPRWICALFVLTGFVLLIVFIALLLLPMLRAQISALVAATPSYVDKFHTIFMPKFEDWVSQFSPDDVQKFRDAAGDSVSSVAEWFANFMRNIVKTSFAVLDIVALTILTPVVAYYMLNDWQKITTAFDSLIPQRYYDVIYAQLKEIDNTLSGFLRGQAIVCAFLSIFYSVGLTIVKLKYGAAIGVVAGFLTFIPYVGTSFGWISSLFLAMAQFDGDWSRILPVVGIFYAGHVMEAYVLTPRFVGDRVNLHPVWILFALLAGAHTMGFTGIMLAVPVAAVAGVLIRFGVKQYRTSVYYKDTL